MPSYGFFRSVQGSTRLDLGCGLADGIRSSGFRVGYTPNSHHHSGKVTVRINHWISTLCLDKAMASQSLPLKTEAMMGIIYTCMYTMWADTDMLSLHMYISCLMNVCIYICIFSYLYTHTSKISDFETQKSECFPSSPVKNSNRMPSGNQTWQWKIPRNGGFYMGKSSNEMVDISYISIYR